MRKNLAKDKSNLKFFFFFLFRNFEILIISQIKLDFDLFRKIKGVGYTTWASNINANLKRRNM